MFACGELSHRLAVFEHGGTGLLLHLLPGDSDLGVLPVLAARAPVCRDSWERGWGREPPASDVAQGGISWHRARAWLEQVGDGLRLPREAEWEYACRAGSRTSWFFGDEWDSTWCWVLDNAGGAPRSVKTHHDRTNAFGLVDVAGNVSEWCADDLDVPMQGSSWQEGNPGKVHRGGSFDHPSAYCRSDYRSGSSPTAEYPDLGLRVFRSLAEPS